MSKILDFNTIYKLNEYLKENGIDYTVHSAGACGGESAELRQVGDKEVSSDEICKVINEYLKEKFMQVAPIYDGAYDIKVI